MLKLKSTILPAMLVFTLAGTGTGAFAANKADENKASSAGQKSKSKMASVLPKEKKEAIHFWTRLSGTAAAEGKSVDQYFKDTKAEWETFLKAHPKVSEVMVKHSEEMAKFRKERMNAKAKGMSRDERRQFAQDMKAKMMEIKKRHKDEIHMAIEQEQGK